MDLRKVLTDIVRVVTDEAAQNPEFNRRLEEVLGPLAIRKDKRSSAVRVDPGPRQRGTEQRSKNRRSAAIVNPIDLASEGEKQLRARLAALTLDQLKDVVADYGMDPGRLVMKWKDPDRVIERIVELSMSRARKGDAFRGPESRSGPTTCHD